MSGTRRAPSASDRRELTGIEKEIIIRNTGEMESFSGCWGSSTAVGHPKHVRDDRFATSNGKIGLPEGFQKFMTFIIVLRIG